MNPPPSKQPDVSDVPSITPAQLAALPQAEPLVLPELVAHRERLARHRSAAFVRYLPAVAGFRLRPVSLRSLERLAAFECDLGRGAFEDLAVFVWIHHPAFGQFAGVRRWLVTRRLRWRLTARWPRLAGLLLFAGKLLGACQGWRWLLGRLLLGLAWLVTGGGAAPDTAERLAAALGEARREFARARTDWPAGDDSGSAAALPCSFTAFVLNQVKGRHPQLTADEILDWPLVELVQWLRAILHERNPRQELIDATEAALLAEALSVPSPPAATGSTAAATVSPSPVPAA